MVSDSTQTHELWLLLWSQVARRLIVGLPRPDAWALLNAGRGWGLSCADQPRRALLLHPSGAGRAVGDLSLTVLGYGTNPIPRCGQSFPAYLSRVEDAVLTAAGLYLAAGE